MSKVGFVLVAPDMMHTWTALDCMHAIAYQSAAVGDDVQLTYQEGSVLSEARQKAMRRCYDEGCDWIFSVDSDMRFPVNTIEGMKAHNLPVVAANCSRRKRPISPIARRTSAWIHQDDEATQVVYPDRNVTGVERVETVGFGVILIRRDVLDEIEWPWFDTPWQPEQERHVGEDIFFCGRCYEAGIPIHIDHDLSWAVKHLGLYDYGMKDCVNEAALVDSGAWGEEMLEKTRPELVAGD